MIRWPSPRHTAGRTQPASGDAISRTVVPIGQWAAAPSRGREHVPEPGQAGSQEDAHGIVASAFPGALIDRPALRTTMPQRSSSPGALGLSSAAAGAQGTEGAAWRREEAGAPSLHH